MKNVILNSKVLRTLLLASSVVLGSFSAQANVILSFSEADIEVGLNDSFSVDLFAETETPADEFIAFSTGLSFDSSILSFDGFILGSDFSTDLLSSDIAGFFNADFSNIFSPILTASGDNILLATLTFTAIDYGMTSLETISESFTGLLSLITIDSESASSTISVVSTPATLGLFAFALLGLVSLRRKRNFI